MSEESSSDRSVHESDEEGGTDTETLTCPLPSAHQLNGIFGNKTTAQELEQSIADVQPPDEMDEDDDSRIVAATQGIASLMEEIGDSDALVELSYLETATPPKCFANGEGNTQELGMCNENKMEVIPPLANEALEIKGDAQPAVIVGEISQDDIQDEKLEMLVKECCSVRETMNEYREKNHNGVFENDAIAELGPALGGDIKHIYMSAAKEFSIKPKMDDQGSKNGEVKDAAVPIVIETPASGGSIKRAEDAVAPRPNSVGVGVARGSEEKKKKGTRLPLPLTPTHSSGGPHPATGSGKKLPILSPLGNKSGHSVGPAASASIALTNKPKSATASPLKVSPYSKASASPSSAGKPRVRAQTARASRPEDSPLAASALALDLPINNKRSSADFSRLLKPTASCSAKYRVGSASASTRTSPSKFGSRSVSDTRLHSTFMMGDAGNGSGEGSPSPTPGATAVGASGEPGILSAGGLKEQFNAFSRFGDATSDGKQITLSNSDKWMKQAHVVDGKKITTTDTSITFKKLFKTAKKVGFDDFKRYVEDLAKNKGLEGKDVLDKLAHCGAPGLSQATKAAHAGVVSRLTDTSKYTGSSKERFDATGKGRGMEGRHDVKDNSGYVAAFKAKQEPTQSPTAK